MNSSQSLVALACQLHADYGGETPTDLGRITVGLGVELCLQPAPPGFRGMLVEIAGRQVIRVNDAIPGPRRRYAIAHELGHALINRGVLRSRGKVERICQLFAAYLLMPPPLLAQRAADCHGTADLAAALAREFNVSRTAMRIHLQRLGILPPRVGKEPPEGGTPNGHNFQLMPQDANQRAFCRRRRQRYRNPALMTPLCRECNLITWCATLESGVALA